MNFPRLPLRPAIRFLTVGAGIKALLFGVVFVLAGNPHQASQALTRLTAPETDHEGTEQ